MLNTFNLVFLRSLLKYKYDWVQQSVFESVTFKIWSQRALPVHQPIGASIGSANIAIKYFHFSRKIWKSKAFTIWLLVFSLLPLIYALALRVKHSNSKNRQYWQNSNFDFIAIYVSNKTWKFFYRWIYSLLIHRKEVFEHNAVIYRKICEFIVKYWHNSEYILLILLL